MTKRQASEEQCECPLIFRTRAWSCDGFQVDAYLSNEVVTQSRKVADVGPGRKSLAERTDVHCNSGCQCTWSDRNHPIQLIERLFTGMQDVGPESYSENNNRKDLSRIGPVVRCAFAHSCTHVWALAEDHKMHGLQLRAVHADLTAPCASFCIYNGDLHRIWEGAYALVHNPILNYITSVAVTRRLLCAGNLIPSGAINLQVGKKSRFQSAQSEVFADRISMEILKSFPVFGCVHLSIGVGNSDEGNNALHSILSIDDAVFSSYVPFCQDFGPVNLGCIHAFCESVDREIEASGGQPVITRTCGEPQSLTNAVFLLGAYMIMRLDMTPELPEKTFKHFSRCLAPYRDVSPGKQNFSLHVRDCWAGLWRAKQLSWVQFGGEDCFDRDEYAELDSPLNADLHVVVPGKFIAMRGPRDLPANARWHDAIAENGAFSHRDFSPAHYADILAQFDVRAVVRLNAPAAYDPAPLRASGIAVADLFFDDCTPPPPSVVAEFLALAEGLPGALAVHCKAGLGRTGTLIALYMMKHHGFTAREAMGWLRIVRPGSVIGEQQDFLCAHEALNPRPPVGAAAPARRAALAADAGLEEVEECVAAIAREHRDRPAAAGSKAAAGGRREATRLAAHVTAAVDGRSGRRASLLV